MVYEQKRRRGRNNRKMAAYVNARRKQHQNKGRQITEEGTNNGEAFTYQKRRKDKESRSLYGTQKFLSRVLLPLCHPRPDKMAGRCVGGVLFP